MEVLFNAPLHYPSAREWMWNYCIYLGPFTDSDGINYDLGIHIGKHGHVSAAIVDGHEDGSYFSGSINKTTRECYVETKRRAIQLGLIKTVKN